MIRRRLLRDSNTLEASGSKDQVWLAPWHKKTDRRMGTSEHDGAWLPASNVGLTGDGRRYPHRTTWYEDRSSHYPTTPLHNPYRKPQLLQLYPPSYP